MARHRLAPRGIYRRVDPITRLQPVRRRLYSMADRLALGLNIDDASRGARPAQQSGVGRLPTALGVEGRLVQENISLPRLPGYRKNIRDSRVVFQPVVADEPAGAPGQRGGEGAGRVPAPITLALHEGSHGLPGDAHTTLLGQFRGELDREAECVMEVEHFLGVKGSALEQRLEALHPLPQCDPEEYLVVP